MTRMGMDCSAAVSAAGPQASSPAHQSSRARCRRYPCAGSTLLPDRPIPGTGVPAAHARGVDLRAPHFMLRPRYQLAQAGARWLAHPKRARACRLTEGQSAVAGRTNSRHRGTRCTRTSPLPLLPSGPGGIGGIASRGTQCLSHYSKPVVSSQERE